MDAVFFWLNSKTQKTQKTSTPKNFNLIFICALHTGRSVHTGLASPNQTTSEYNVGVYRSAFQHSLTTTTQNLNSLHNGRCLLRLVRPNRSGAHGRNKWIVPRRHRSSLFGCHSPAPVRLYGDFHIVLGHPLLLLLELLVVCGMWWTEQQQQVCVRVLSRPIESRLAVHV